MSRARVSNKTTLKCKQNMAAESKRSSTPVGNPAANNLSFSMDSLQIGDSTRSLLSPLYDSDCKSQKECSLCSDNELSEGELGASVLKESDLVEEHSETITVKKASGKSYSEDSKDLPTGTSKAGYSSSFSSSSFSESSLSEKSQRNHEILKDDSELDAATELSPWEKWLLSKVIEDHKKVKVKTRKKQLQKELTQRELVEKSEKERRADLNRKEWLELKIREEKIRNELKRREEMAKAQKEMEEKERMQEKASESYKKWFDMKENERKVVLRNKRRNEHDKKASEYEHKQRSQRAYDEWLAKARRHKKSTNNHFGYLSGKVTGYYDWTCYPMPSYSNPNPWVGPKIKEQKGKIELQSPSPPLLFKELDERERNAKKGIQSQRIRKSSVKFTNFL